MIKISTKGRYSTRILVRLAMNPEQGKPVSKHDISVAEGISGDYVEQILLRLGARGFVNSHRGKKGGFSLARPAASITVCEVMEALEGPIALAPCMSGDCSRETQCATQALWKRIGGLISDELSAVTIEDLARKAAVMNDGGNLSFQI